MILVKNCQTISDPLQEICSRLQRGQSDSFFYIAPTKRLIRKLQREFLNECPNGVAPAFNLFTLETLTRSLYSFLCPQKHPVSGPLQALILSDAIKASAKELSYFRLRR